MELQLCLSAAKRSRLAGVLELNPELKKWWHVGSDIYRRLVISLPCLVSGQMEYLE